MSAKDDDYATVRIPRELAEEIESLIGKRGFRTKAEVVKEAIRNLLNHYEELEKRSLPRFEKINNDENGVKILDRELHETVEVFVKPNGINCSYHQRTECEHVTYALSFPEVKALIRKHRKKGWKLPDI
jgi:Arc/MetJ-type ribon-helix-helix transcriptional regulator